FRPKYWELGRPHPYEALWGGLVSPTWTEAPGLWGCESLPVERARRDFLIGQAARVATRPSRHPIAQWRYLPHLRWVCLASLRAERTAGLARRLDDDDPDRHQDSS